MKRKIKPIKKRKSTKKCFFCQDKKEPDYKNWEELKPFLSEWARILPREVSSLCAKHQRQLTREIKKARFLALLPYVRRVE